MKKAERFMEVALGVTSVLVGMTASLAAHAADTTVGMDVASAYVFRGNTLNDGPVLQPAFSVGNFKLNDSFTLPLTLGVWANMDIGTYHHTLDKGQFSEVDFTASYALPKVIDKLGWSAGYCDYVYPGGAASDREANLGFTYDTFLSPSLAFNYGLDGAVRENTYIEGGLKHAFKLDPVTLTLGGTLGYQIVSESEASGFGPLVLTASASYSILTASVSYVAEVGDGVLANYDVKVVGKLGIAYTF
jgi:uncharacterized protein (TIGR02001 family)